VLPATWSHGNPVDILGDAHGDRYAAAMRVLLDEKETDAVLVLNCPTAVANSTEIAATLVATLPDKRTTPVLTCWLGDPAAVEGRRLFTAARVPTYETPEEAARAFMHLVEYARNQEMLLETPPASRKPIGAGARATVRGIIDVALGEKRALLNEVEAKAVLRAYGIATVETRTATDPRDAARIAGEIKRRVVLKILSPDISHKSDAGGVRLDLDGPEAVEKAATEMLATVKQRVPGARIAGFVVEEMIVRPQAHELLLGVGDDRVFGPILLFGQGGTAAEVIRDRAIGLPPLNRPLALDLIGRTRIAALLKGYRDRPPVDLDAVADTLVALSELIVDFPEVAELDINPLIADDKGVVALDARVVVRASPASDHMAIRPYPRELEHAATLPGGEAYAIRAIRPEDEPALVAMLNKSSLDDLRTRFPGAARKIPHLMAARLSQIDYDREMALIALSPNGEIHGAARLLADPDNVAAELGVMVRTDMAGRGLGARLFADLVEHARKRGLQRLSSEIANLKRPMLELARDLGFTVEPIADGRVRIALDLTPVS
jgi:acetyltransferase